MNNLIKVIVLFVICLVLMSETKRKMYFWTIQNFDYFLWLQSKGFTATNPIYIPICYISLLIFPFFPIISILFPLDIFPQIGSFYVVPISLHNNKNLCKDIQSKMFWYNFFTKMNINTPKVYYHSNTLINKIPDNKETFIMKPEYGTQGSQVTKVTLEEYFLNSSKNVILQEMIKDCNYDKARFFRIHTISNNSIFSIIEKKQNNNKIAPNGANGAESRVCKNLICDFLDQSEQIEIDNISLRLANVHSQNLKDIPHIGWDVCLTCDGAYVFEGNLGAYMEDNYKEYLKIITKFY